MKAWFLVSLTSQITFQEGNVKFMNSLGFHYACQFAITGTLPEIKISTGECTTVNLEKVLDLSK